jgi:crossover junction endodeoxyribonuclease RuvC
MLFCTGGGRRAAQIAQEVASRWLRRRPVARAISRSFSWRAWWTGALAAAIVGAALCWAATPFKPIPALVMGFIAGGSGSFGEFVMKALKKDAGVRSWGGRLGDRRGRPARPRGAAVLRGAGVLPPCAGTSVSEPAMATIRILGIDPGLRTTGFGVIEADGPRLHYVASGTTDRRRGLGDLPARLKIIFEGVREVAARYQPDCASVEIVFVNVNPQSTLLLGQARGAALAALVSGDLAVAEYTALQMKKAVVGHGQARKEQVQAMVARALALPGEPGKTPPTPWAWRSATPMPAPRLRRWRAAARCRARPTPSTRRAQLLAPGGFRRQSPSMYALRRRRQIPGRPRDVRSRQLDADRARLGQAREGEGRQRAAQVRQAAAGRADRLGADAGARHRPRPGLGIRPERSSALPTWRATTSRPAPASRSRPALFRLFEAPHYFRRSARAASRRRPKRR